jgi:hypothetical protein
MSDAPSIRKQYADRGVTKFYAQEGGAYRNPHESSARLALAEAVKLWPLDLSRVLDLACGSGEMTLELHEHGAGQIDGVDAYTGDAYRQRTGQDAICLSFEQIAAGALAERRYSHVVCSYALHLVERSRLPGLLWALGQISPALLILSPHKRPQLDPDWGWRFVDELYVQRVRTRLYHWDGASPAL